MNSLTALAKNAKNRLNIRSEYREKCKSISLRAERNFLATSDILKEEKEDVKFKTKVAEICESENVLTPFKELMDRKYFESLNETDKQRYILKLSNKYLNAKAQLLKETE